MGTAGPDKPQRRRAVYLVDARRGSDPPLTQAQLSDMSGVAQNTISNLERHRPAYRDPRLKRTTRLLAIALGIDPEWLRFGPNPKRRAAVRRHRETR